MIFEIDKSPIVLDNGTGTLKIGYASEMQPRVVVPTILGRPKHQKIYMIQNSDLCFAGDVMNRKRGALTLTYPIVNGMINYWEDLETLWQHLFTNELRIMPENHPILLTEVALNPKSHRAKMVEVLFEKFHVPGLHISIPNVLSLYASGRTTGLVLDCGEGVTSLVPVYDAFAIPSAMHRRNLAGLDLTNYLKSLLNKRGYKFLTSCEHEIVRDIKETMCLVATNYRHELDKKSKTYLTHYHLPDGQMLEIGNERFETAELMFDPKMGSYECAGIQYAIRDSINSCEIDVRKDFWSNIILTGGGTMFPGFVERLNDELVQLAPKGVPVKLHASPERKYAAWVGGAVLASLSTFNDMWVMKNQYDEYGMELVHKKCV